MIAGCPNCAARYRIDTAKLRPEGVRLRCARCETVFRVHPPTDAAESAPPAPVAAAASAPPDPAVASAQAPAPAADPAAAPDPARQVLIADSDLETGKALTDAVSGWGLSPLLVHDGVEAILQIQRALPRVVVLDAALPRMSGFQVCELMKRNEQLRSIPVVLVGAVQDQERHRRPPESGYGADAYFERPELPELLAEQLGRFGLDLSGAPAQAPESGGPVPSASGDAGSAADPETEKALRLARIIVSDLVLYNAEKFEVGVRDGNVVELLADQLEEGYALFAQRVGTSACDAREFVERELVRVARSRGMV